MLIELITAVSTWVLALTLPRWRVLAAGTLVFAIVAYGHAWFGAGDLVGMAFVSISVVLMPIFLAIGALIVGIRKATRRMQAAVGEEAT